MGACRANRVLVALGIVIVIASGCSAADSQRYSTARTEPSTSTTSSTASASTGAMEPAAPSFESPTSGELAARFATGTVTVDGRVSHPVWVADTDARRSRGLMEVTDTGLEGRQGMVFTFPSETAGGFWMRNTRIPLDIVFVRTDGSVVAIESMFPCPDSAPRCPITRPGSPYRWALEVPAGRLDALSIDLGSRLVISSDAGSS